MKIKNIILLTLLIIVGGTLGIFRLNTVVNKKILSLSEKLNILGELKHFANRPYYYMGDNTGLTLVDDGLFMYVDTRDRSLAPHLIHSGVWEINNTKVFKAFLRNRKNVVDAGANLGYFTLIAAHEFRKNKIDGKVFTIEALPRLSSLLRHSVLQNGLFPFVTFINNVVGNKETELEYVEFSNAMGGSSVAQEDVLNYYRTDESIYKNYEFKVIKLQAKLLDQIIPVGTSIDLLRMDIQGSEFLALEGAKRVLSESDNIIIMMEYEASLLDKFSNVSLELNNLAKNGFKFWLITEAGTLTPITKEELLEIKTTRDIIVSKIDVLKEYPELK